ncbi:MAG: hypothetical protein EOP62_00085 [Sphingomonadales bacterium]|nr:MAG: hypothetical protein EOP62_00085 [Sphingomonadales bacterium]
MNKSILLGAAAALALLAGCSSESVTNTTSTTTANVTAPEPVANTSVTANATVSETAVPALNLAPDELTLVLEGGSARHVTFGMDKAMATQMITAALGSPIEQATLEDCGAGKLDYANFRQGLSLYFQDGKFQGWDLDGRENGKFQTANGIGIGTTRKQVEGLGSVLEMQPESTIGHEFMIGEMSGLLSDTTPGGKVTNLWAGVSCIAR